MLQLSENNKVQRVESEVVVTKLEETFVMLHIEQSKYYNLNGVSSDIWEQLEHAVTVNEIVNSICQKYDCTQEQCLTDVLDFLNQLNDQNLLKIL